MRNFGDWLRELMVFVGCFTLILIFSGCTAIEKREDMQVERTLSAAGFKMRFADSQQQLKNTTEMTQRKLVPQISDGQTVYVYADAKFCKCIYVGSEAAYQRYQKLAIQKEIANERMEAAEMNEDAMMDWGAWGPWGPWGP